MRWGQGCSFLARNNYNVTAFDASEKGLSKARELADKCGVEIDFFKADVRDFRLETDYDIIFSSSVFYYIPLGLRENVVDIGQLYPT
ncbi:MAG: class I SAM-dependent methyltransferase [Oscillospiraceae bacterium]